MNNKQVKKKNARWFRMASLRLWLLKKLSSGFKVHFKVHCMLVNIGGMLYSKSWYIVFLYHLGGRVQNRTATFLRTNICYNSVNMHACWFCSNQCCILLVQLAMSTVWVMACCVSAEVSGVLLFGQVEMDVPPNLGCD